MTDLTHKDRAWCVLPEGREGRCLPDWEKRHLDHLASFKSFRGRRYNICTAIGELDRAIDHLGDESGKNPVYIDPAPPAPPTDQVKAELKNLTQTLLRLLLILNDGNVPAKRL